LLNPNINFIKIKKHIIKIIDNIMQSPAKETLETGLIELPQALEDYRNPSNQHYTPQFGVSGGICSVFQYIAPKAGPQ